MSSYEETIALEWPYPVNYGKETEVSCDVLILGGGITGSNAAIEAAKKGAKVVVLEKGNVKTSGSGGTGVDHWMCACNPVNKVTAEEMFKRRQARPSRGPGGGLYGLRHLMYISLKESWNALMDLEKMGLEFRDVNDEFKGAPFRDEETKIMFAYDYAAKSTIRIRGGAFIKPVMYEEMKRLGVTIHNRVMATSLLTEGGMQGEKVVGATGVNVRTGEFYIFKAKATVLSTGQFLHMWVFSTELAGSNAEHDDPNCSGGACAIAWRAGAELTLMENSEPSGGGFRYPSYGVGLAGNTWYPCTLVDANGKEIPWVDREGNFVKTISERTLPTPGQRGGMGGRARLIPDLPERIKKGEFALPLFADLPNMPEHERRAIWGLMVGNEGKTRIIYKQYSEAGFDPDKDLLQASVFMPEAARRGDYWQMASPGTQPPQWRSGGGPAWRGGGLVVDWNLKTSLEGLYAGGNSVAGAGGHVGAASSGRYVGRNAAEYALKAKQTVLNRKQVEKEKARVYAPINRENGIGWKELHAGICRMMQDYCGKDKNETLLNRGLWWLNSIHESEASKAYARNPHELKKTLECFARLTVGEAILNASLARKASSRSLHFNRMDYPEMDPPEWNKYVTIHLENGKVKVGELPLNYWLQPPNALTYEENYRKHCCV